MAVQIPKLPQIQPAKAMPSNDRINFKAQDQSSLILSRTEGVEQIGNAVGDIYQKEENAKIDTIGADVTQRYKQWSDAELDRIKNMTGDPTKAYEEYETKKKEKFDSLLNEYGDVPDRVKRHVTARATKAQLKEDAAATHQNGMQQEVYANNVFESQIKSTKDNLAAKSTGYIRRKDSSSYEFVDDDLQEISKTIARRAEQKGSAVRLPDDAKDGFNYVYKDDDGKPVKMKLDQLALGRIAKENSEAIKGSIEVLLSAGRVEEAEEMRERYKDRLGLKETKSLASSMTGAVTKKAAYAAFAERRGKGLSSFADIENPEVRDRAEALYNAAETRREAAKIRQQKLNYDVVAKKANKGIEAGQFLSFSDLQESEGFDLMWSNLSAKQQDAVKEKFENRKNSDPKVVSKLNEFIQRGGQDLKTITREEYEEQFQGLTKTEREAKWRTIEKLQNPSNAAEIATHKRAAEFLRTRMIDTGLVRPNKFKGASFVADKDLPTFNEANDRMMALIDEQGPMSDTQMKELVNDWVDKGMKDKMRATIEEDANSPAFNQGVRAIGKDIQFKSKQDQAKWMKKYSDANNGRELVLTNKRDEALFETFVKRNINRTM